MKKLRQAVSFCLLAGSFALLLSAVQDPHATAANGHTGETITEPYDAPYNPPGGGTKYLDTVRYKYPLRQGGFTYSGGEGRR